MSENDNKVVDLGAVREKRAHDSFQNLHEQRLNFKLQPYEFSDDIGILEHDDKPICVILWPESLEGIHMSREDAHKLGEALIACADFELPPEEQE